MQREAALQYGTSHPAPYAGQSGVLCTGVPYWPHGDRDWILLYVLTENARMGDELNESNNRNLELEAENAELRAENAELRAENQRLYEQAHLDCQTSGIPPSIDRKKRGASGDTGETTDTDAGQDNHAGGKEPTVSVSGYLKGREKKAKGGQPNHPPASMNVGGARDGAPVAHYPNKCNNCPNLNQCIADGCFKRSHTSHEYDIEVTLVHTEHRVFEATQCPDDGSQIRGDIPEGIIGTQYYGINVRLHVLVWHHLFHGSYDRIAQAAKEMFRLSLSAGTAYAIVRRVSDKILGSGLVDAIRFFILLFEAVAGVDETSAPVAGMNAWVHTVATAGATLLSAHWRRGFEGTVYAGVVQFFTNTIISDCWAAYFKETFKFKHAICDAHILRELVAAAYFRYQSWAIKMFDLLLEVFTAKRDAVERGDKSLPQEYIDGIRVRYRQIVADGYNEIAGETKGKTFSLLERLKNLEDAALAFAVDFRVDFTNNASEQSLRNLKVVLRVIGQFKTMQGLVDYCVIQSFMDTCRKQGHNPFDMLKVLLTGGDIIEALFGSEKAALIKLMIRLTRALAEGDTNEIDAIKAKMGATLTDELLAAASFGSFKAYNDPPPENKTAPKANKIDKMKAARERVKRNNSSTTAEDLSAISIRAGPNCA